ncbi:MAG: PHB depolymerase family esterase [Rhodanobacter sp.]
MKPFNPSLQQAMRLMRSGDLHAATRAIQQGLAASEPCSAHNDDTFHASDAPAATDCIDGEFRVVDRVDATDERDAASAANPPTAGRFETQRFVGDTGELDYKLYVPAGLDTTNAPLLLMLHGCTQSPDDFARGTRMNALADKHGYVVAYPEQPASRNATLCWNWFRRGDQQRESGEPALLAALTRRLIATHGIDERRVYVAGLSAGGAMAAILASTHPDLYAAIGVHSGLPVGLASDVPSALAAMRGGVSRRSATASNSGSRPVPAIVFHGDKDTTVHPDNGHGVIAQSLADDGVHAAAAKGAHVERGIAAGGRRYTRTVHKLADGSVAAEHWIVEGAGHAWFGGDAAGSYTDPHGPDASAQMLRFFSACVR